MQYFNPVRIAAAGLMSAALVVVGVAASPAIAQPSSSPVNPDAEQGQVRAQVATETVTLSFRWSLAPWQGVDGVPVGEAIRGTGAAEGGNDISGDVLALFEWNSTTQRWSAYFVSGEGVPGANDLETLQRNIPYWIAIEGPGNVSWTVATPDD